MTPPPLDVGALVPGAPTAPRALVRHAGLLAAYADGRIDDGREAYLSHLACGPGPQAHHAAHRGSVAGFAGPCWCRWLVLDLDRPDPADALTDARRLVTFLHDRYRETDGDVPGYFSGDKGFHVLVGLAHAGTPPTRRVTACPPSARVRPGSPPTGTRRSGLRPGSSTSAPPPVAPPAPTPGRPATCSTWSGSGWRRASGTTPCSGPPPG